MKLIHIIASNLYANYDLTFSNKVFNLLAQGLNKNLKYNYLGVLKFYEGDVAAAINYFIDQLKITPFDPSPHTNLAFVSTFYGDESTKQFVIEQIDHFFPENKRLLKLKLSLMLSLNRQKGIEHIHRLYIDKWIKKAIVRPAKKPILFFHIPKCGGTTITDSLYNHFYESTDFCLPSYFEKNLLKYCIEEIPDVFPFLSTRHVSLKELNVSFSNFYTISCLRDPLKRNISAFRQTRSGNKNGRFFRVIPKYGSHWNSGKVITFKDWVDFAPVEELNHQLSTFSEQMRVEEFNAVVSQIDYLMFLENFQNQQKGLMSELGIKLLASNDANKKLNQSSKNIKISSDELLYAKEKLKKEEQAVNMLRSLHSK